MAQSRYSKLFTEGSSEYAIQRNALVPVYNFGIYMPLTGSRIPFSHAFFGAYRHAITVGFIMMMIIGVSSKIAPTLSGIDLRRAASLWPTFILLNLGNAMRVTFQIATDYTPSAFPIMGVSGFIEVIGLTLWAYELASNMLAGVRMEKQRYRDAVVRSSSDLGKRVLVEFEDGLMLGARTFSSAVSANANRDYKTR